MTEQQAQPKSLKVRSAEALLWLFEAEGLSGALRQIKGLCHKKATALIESATAEKLNAPKWLQAADELEKIIDKIQYEIRL